MTPQQTRPDYQGCEAFSFWIDFSEPLRWAVFPPCGICASIILHVLLGYAGSMRALVMNGSFNRAAAEGAAIFALWTLVQQVVRCFSFLSLCEGEIILKGIWTRRIPLASIEEMTCTVNHGNGRNVTNIRTAKESFRLVDLKEPTRFIDALRERGLTCEVKPGKQWKHGRILVCLGALCVLLAGAAIAIAVE